QFVPYQSKRIYVKANRGTSGIDGNIATALGITEALYVSQDDEISHTSTLVIGDLALYHDLNSLHLIRRLNIPLVIVCINNDGGGIFHRLPIAGYDPPLRAFFFPPHGLRFETRAEVL